MIDHRSFPVRKVCVAEAHAHFLRGIQVRPANRTNSASVTPERSTTPVLPSAGSKAKSATSPHRETLPCKAAPTNFLSSPRGFGLDVRPALTPDRAAGSVPSDLPGRTSAPRHAEPPFWARCPPDATRPHSARHLRPRVLSLWGRHRRARVLSRNAWRWPWPRSRGLGATAAPHFYQDL